MVHRLVQLDQAEFRSPPSSLWLSEYLLEKAQVLFAPGIAYLGEGYLRVSFRDPLTEEDIQTAVRRVREAIATRP